MELTFKPTPKQLIACEKWNDSTTKEIAYGGAKNGGKSFLGGSLIFNDALTYPDTFFFIARQKLNDLRKYTQPTIQEIFKKWEINITDYAPFNGQDNYYQCYNGSRVYLLEASYLPSDPLFERFGSMQMTRGWIEEGGEISALAKSNLWIACGRWNNDKYNLLPKLLVTCNPKRNWLYTDFYKPYSNNTLPKSKAFIQALVTDNTYRQSESEEQLKTLKGVARERLYLGNWEYINDPSQLITSEAIENIFTNDFVKAEGKKYITADIARFGDDKIVIRVWHGWRVIQRVVMTKARLTDTAEMIKKLADANQIPMSQVLCDEDGVGGGVVDILRCKGFVANSSPLKTGNANNINYDNLKSQCGYHMAQMVNDNGVYENVEDEDLRESITEELTQIKQKSMDRDGKRALMPKDKIKEAIGRSPDDSDTYLMRAFFDLNVAPGVGFVKPGQFKASNGRSINSM